MYKKLLKHIDDLKNKILDYNIFINDELIESLQNYYHVRLTYSSNYIEGFTYTEEETYNLIFNHQVANFKSALETGAVKAHDLCFKHMMTLQNDDYIEEVDILKFHELLLGGLENQAIACRYRDREVRVGNQIFMPSFKVKSAMRHMFELLETAKETIHPVLFAIRIHKDIIFIHPFMDGNGRVARLAMNTVMLQNKFLPIDIPPNRRFDYQMSIQKNYEDNTSFYMFMLNQAVESHLFMLNKLKDRTKNVDEKCIKKNKPLKLK
jgi:Fic family protein